MPQITAKKKLTLPIAAIFLVLIALAWLPGTGEKTELFAIGHGGEVYLPLKKGFACLSSSGIDIYDYEGKLLFREERALTPSLSASDGEKLAVAAGEELRLYSHKGYEGSIAASGEILAIQLRGEILAVSRKNSYYKSAITFYEQKEPLFTRYLAAGECRDILLLSECACLLLPGQLQFISGPGQARILPFEGGLRLHYAEDGLCAETASALHFYSAKGESRGVFTEEFSEAESFGSTLCARVRGGIAVIADGEIRHFHRESNPLFFGKGERPTLITGEKTFIFNRKLEITYSIENKYIPSFVLTDKDAAVLLWQSAAEVHRK